MSILNITETGFDDDSIEEYEHFEYLPIVGAVNNLNNDGGDIAINIETQDIFMLPSESYLLIEGRLLKNDDTVYAAANEVALTNNGIMYLFNNIRYELSGKEIERIAHPGWATTMLGLLKYDDDFSKSQGLNQLWYKDTARNAAIAENGGFRTRRDYIIAKPEPLKHIFGFCEDYDKILYGMKQTLYLTRTGNSDAIFKAGAADEGKVVLEKIALYMPHVLPTDKYKMELYKHIQNKESFPVNYRMIQCDTAQVSGVARSFTWRLAVKTAPEFPRYIIIGFQTNKKNNQDTNPAIFDHLNVTDIHVTLNSHKYPKIDYRLSFGRYQFSRAYGDVAAFRSKFFLMDDLASNPNLTPLEHKELYPLFLFDVGKQSERLKYSVTDIHIKANFSLNVPALPLETHAYAVMISDRRVNFQSDGNKMSVVY